MKISSKWARLLAGIFLLTALVLPGAVTAEEIKIGVLFPLTGGAASAGRELRIEQHSTEGTFDQPDSYCFGNL